LYLLRLWLAVKFGGFHHEEAGLWLDSFSSESPNFLVHWLVRMGRFLIHNNVPLENIQSNPLFWKQMELRLAPYFVQSVILPLALAKSIEWSQRHSIKKRQIFLLLTTPFFIFFTQFVTQNSILISLYALTLLCFIRLLRTRSSSSVAGDRTPFRPGIVLLFSLCTYFLFKEQHLFIFIPILAIASGLGLANTFFYILSSFFIYIGHQYFNGSVNESFFSFINNISKQFYFTNYNENIFYYLFGLNNPLYIVYFLIFAILSLKYIFVKQEKSRLSGNLILWTLFPFVFFLALKNSLTPSTLQLFIPIIISCLIPLIIFVIQRSQLLFRCFFLMSSNIVLIFIFIFALGQNSLTQQAQAPFTEKIPALEKLMKKYTKTFNIHNFYLWEDFFWQIESISTKQGSIQIHDDRLYAISQFYNTAEKQKIYLNKTNKNGNEKQDQHLYHVVSKNDLLNLTALKSNNKCNLINELNKSGSDFKPWFIYKCTLK